MKRSKNIAWKKLLIDADPDYDFGGSEAAAAMRNMRCQ